MNLRLLKALVSLILLFSVPLLAQAPHSPISTLQDAIATGKATAQFNGDGGSSGDSIKVRVAKGPKAGPGPEEVSLPAGSVLESGDAGAQNMMVAGVEGKDLGGGLIEPAPRIVLTSGRPVTYVLAAYCIQFEKENPSPATSFTLGRPDAVLACIAKKGRSLTVPALQAAVWMYTDNITYSRMSHKFPVNAEDWAAAQGVFQACRNVSARNSGVVPTVVGGTVEAAELPIGVPPVPGIQKTAFSLLYQDITIGAGSEAEPNKLYKVHYTGWRAADGVKFDSSYDHARQPLKGDDGKPVVGDDGKPRLGDPRPMAFPQGMGRLIPGFDQGFAGMRVGGKRRLFIPWQLAYGTRNIPDRPSDQPGGAPRPGIPPKSDLIFDVELVDVTDLPTPPKH